MRNEKITPQDLATESQKIHARNLLRQLVFELVQKEGHGYFCISNGQTLWCLLDEKVCDGLFLNHLYTRFVDSVGDDATDIGFISFLEENHPKHAKFTKEAMRMFRNEHANYMANKFRGPCFHYTGKKGYIRMEDLQSKTGCLKDSYWGHQMTLELEADTQAYFVGDLTKEVLEKTGVSISAMFETHAKGNCTGYHTTMCATSLTSLKASLVKDGTLAINEYSSDEFKLQLTRPLSKDGKEVGI